VFDGRPYGTCGAPYDDCPLVLPTGSAQSAGNIIVMLRTMSDHVGPQVEGDIRLLVGPANFAGQGHAWAMAARTLHHVSACSFAVANDADFTMGTDYSVDRNTFADEEWSQRHEEWVGGFTHVLIEAGRPITGLRHGLDCEAEVPVLEARGVKVAMVAHGSDVRRPLSHRRREPDSPFVDLDSKDTRTRQKYADRIAPLIDSRRWAFASTPDLIEDVPSARWLPVVVDPARWLVTSWEPPAGRGAGLPPLVVHVPSSTRMKGTEAIEPVLEKLVQAGRIRYRPLRSVPHHDMPAVLAEADIILDQFAIGSYGVAAVEGLAAGRVVIGHVRPEVRHRVLQDTGWSLPIVEGTPATLAQVIEELVADVSGWQDQALLGPAFVDDVHDGRLSAAVLDDFLLAPTA